MKRLLQFVVVVLLTCQAAPPSIAEGLCIMLRSAHPMDMGDCCVGMQHTMMRDIPSTFVQAPSCDGTCCYVSPQSSQIRTTPQLLADSAPSPALNSAAILPISNANDHHESASPPSAPAR